MWTSIEPYSVLFVSALLSYLVSLSTSKATYKSGINKDLFDKRQIGYQNILKTFKKIEKNGYLIFDKVYVLEIEAMHSSIQLIASKKIKKEIESLSELILKKYKDYNNLYNEFAIDEEVNNRATFEANRDQEEYIEKMYYFRDQVEQDSDTYMERNRLSENEVKEKIEIIVTLMRNDLHVTD